MVELVGPSLCCWVGDVIRTLEMVVEDPMVTVVGPRVFPDKEGMVREDMPGKADIPPLVVDTAVFNVVPPKSFVTVTVSVDTES